MSLLYKEINELLVVETEGATVEPYEEGSLWAQRTDARDMLSAIILYESDVVLYVGKHCLSPFFSLAEGGNGGDGSKQGRFV